MFPLFEAFAEMVREQTKEYAQAQDRICSRQISATLDPLRLVEAIRSRKDGYERHTDAGQPLSAIAGLTVIDGGKDDLLPAEPRKIERRRRVGEE